MKIICLIKCVIKEEEQNSHQIRKNKKKLIINPDDNHALEVALSYKDKNPKTDIEVVTMGPDVIKSLMEELIRKGVDRATILTDLKFKGSDTYATSLILSRYLLKCNYDLLLTGNKSIDGDTGQIGTQVATWLELNQYSNVSSVNLSKKEVIIDIDLGVTKVTVNHPYPIVLSCNSSVSKRPRFVKAQNRNKNVKEKISILNNQDLNCDKEKIGLKGSPTIVKKVINKEQEQLSQNMLNVSTGSFELIQRIGGMDNESTYNN